MQTQLHMLRAHRQQRCLRNGREALHPAYPRLRALHRPFPTSCRTAAANATIFVQPLEQPPLGCRRRQTHRSYAPIATAAAFAASSSPGTVAEGNGASSAFASIRASAAAQLTKLEGLWGRFVPMSALFFLMAFVNTIIDSLKDSLVITAVGGGTQVLPYLSVYAVLPSSILFLVAYSWATRRFSRDKLFNGIVCVFMLFYGMFAFAYPYHEALHLSSWADGLAAILPSGLSGMVGMVRNWMFTLFYCGAELWGDVVLSLLFWGLANETTSIEDAPLLYPLFGLGANLAQTIAGRFLRLFSDAAGVHVSYTMQLQATVGLCVAMGCVIIVLHTFISKTFPKNPKGSTSAKLAGARAQAAAAAAEAAAMVKREEEHRHHQIKLDLEASVRGLNYCDLDTHNGIDKGTKTAWSSANGSSVEARASINNSNNDNNNSSTGDHDRTQHSMTSSVTPSTSGNASSYSVARKEDQAENSSTSAYSPSPPSHPGNGNATPSVQKSSSSAEAATLTSKVPSSMSLKDAWEFLRRSPQIRCLAVMAVAQGITTRLLEVTWKHYLHQLHSSPAAYAAFLGDTAMWTGIVTGSLMFTSPLLFDRIGWKGVASVTPKFMLWFGVPFFVGCIAYNLFSGHVLATGTVTLQALVIVGALLQVFSRGAKFSLFKPAEEMVYIGLDDESRTKGKAAIDVVGSQSGKSVGSVLQQALLILTGGTVGGIVPLLAVFYAVMLHRWTDAVSDLAEHYDPAHVHRMSVMASIDEDDDPSGSPVSSDNGAIAAAPGLRRNENSTSRGNGNGHSEQPFPASA